MRPRRRVDAVASAKLGVPNWALEGCPIEKPADEKWRNPRHQLNRRQQPLPMPTMPWKGPWSPAIEMGYIVESERGSS